MRISKIKMFFKFNKYSFIETFWTLCSLAMDLIILHHWNWRPSNIFILNAIFVVFAFFTFYGGFRAFVSWKSYKVRKEDYLRCIEMFSKYGVKKSVLYNLQKEPCSQEVAKQLAKEFNVELEKIKD